MTHATKILPPVLPSWCIRRTALERHLDEGLERRLITVMAGAVVAGAGFGKSTALSHLSADRAWPAEPSLVERALRIEPAFVRP